MSTLIHKTAIIDSGAQIDDTASIGAYSIIGKHVKIGAHCVINPHVVISGHTTFGCNNKVYQFASIGDNPQDKKYDTQKAELVIGDNNIIREYCTINAGYSEKTMIGNNNWLMISSHIGHDCNVGNNTLLVNGATLGGHVEVRDNATIGAYVKIHQFCRIGEYSFSTDASILQDVPPYVIAYGSPAKSCGLNKIGLKRHDFSEKLIKILHRCYMQLVRKSSKKNEEDIDIEKYVPTYPEVRLLVNFIKSSSRGIIK